MPARRAASITLMTLWCAAVASAEMISDHLARARRGRGQLGRQRLDAAAVDRLLLTA